MSTWSFTKNDSTTIFDKKSIVWGPRAGFIYVKKERERERAKERGLYGDSCDRLRIQCFVVHRAGR
jgi:hypothetical protein